MKKEHIQKMHEQAEKVFNYAIADTADYREPWRVFRIMSEFVDGYQFLSQLENEVTILGSARLSEEDKYYKIARELGNLLGKNGFMTMTGGGPGIMEAANRGAHEVGGMSLGLNIQLPFEQVLNPYVNRFTSFNYFFTRKVMLTSPATAFVVFPGGFGTMDELFEIADLMDQGFLQKVPIILVGTEFWTPLIKFLKQSPVKLGSIKEEIVDSWKLVDTAADAFKHIKKVKDKPVACDLHPNNFQCVGNIDWKMFRIMAELVEGFEFLTNVKNDITVLGTKHISNKHSYYKDAYKLGQILGEYHYMTVTGGGFGIAEAVNKGTFEKGGVSIGLGIKIANKIEMNPYLNRSLQFLFPFTRKLIVTAPSRSFVFFPGGLGTMHQMFEVLTLMQTKKMTQRPVVLYDHKFWSPLHDFIKKVLVHDFKTIADEDDELYQMVDDVDNIMRVIEQSKPLNGKGRWKKV